MTPENRRGVAYLVAAMGAFILNDALMKDQGATLPAAQMIFVRGLFACALIGASVMLTGAAHSLPRLAEPAVLQRAGLDALGTLLYIGSLMHLPLGNATAINLAAPLLMALLARLVLGERVPLLRWVAIGTGFVGVLLVIQPRGEGFNAWAWVCLAATGCHAARELVTRRIDRALPALTVTLASAIAVTAAAAALTAWQGWRPMAIGAAATLALAAALLATGYFCIVNSMRHGDMSVVAPFRYSALLMALVLGWLVWREVPNALAWAGIALLLAAGLAIAFEGRLRARLQ